MHALPYPVVIRSRDFVINYTSSTPLPNSNHAMKEILPGIFHWTTFHEGILEYVHSYYIEATTPAVLIDPRVPAEGLGWFETHKRPEQIYLTNRHHYRHSGQFAEAFDCTIQCHRAGLHEYSHGEKVTGFDHGVTLPGNIRALEVGVLCPEETALHIPLAGGILALRDAIVRDERSHLAFVADYLMGDDPEAVKRGLREVFKGHLHRKFDHLLLAHGKPVINGGKDELRKFLERMKDVDSGS